MKRILALVLAMMMVAALFAGCGSKEKKDNKEGQSAVEDTRPDAEKLIGTWTGPLDMSEMLQEQVGDEMKISNFAVDVSFTFKEDGTYMLEVSEESVGKAMENLIDSLLPYLKENMKTEAEALGMSVEQLLEAYGMTEDDLGELMLSMVDTSSIMGSLKNEGKYEVKDGKIYHSADLEEEIDETAYEEYILEGDTLTLTASHGDEDAEKMILAFPLVLHRAG